MMNYWNNYSGFNNQWTGGAPFHTGFGFGIFGILFALFMIVLVVWSLTWKGLALWRAAHRNSKSWFVVLLIVNTAGILEILYLYVFSKRNKAIEK